MTWTTPANPIGTGTQIFGQLSEEVIFAQWTKLSTCITDQNLSLYGSVSSEVFITPVWWDPLCGCFVCSS